MSEKFTEAFEQAIESDSNAVTLDRIETRRCGSDNFDGVEYKFYGGFVPIRPIIDIVAEVEGYAIEQLFYCSDDTEPYLCAFVVDLPERPHPAFVDGKY